MITAIALPSAPVSVMAERNFPGFSFEKLWKNVIARSDGAGCGVFGLLFTN